MSIRDNPIFKQPESFFTSGKNEHPEDDLTGGKTIGVKEKIDDIIKEAGNSCASKADEAPAKQSGDMER